MQKPLVMKKSSVPFWVKKVHSLKLTAHAPENWQYSNHPFSGLMLVSGLMFFAQKDAIKKQQNPRREGSYGRNKRVYLKLKKKNCLKKCGEKKQGIFFFKKRIRLTWKGN